MDSVIGGKLRNHEGKAMPVSTGRLLGPGNLVLLSGQLAFGPDGKISGTTVAEQTHMIFDKIEGLLREVNLDLSHIVKNTIWLTDAANFPAFNEAYGSRLSEPYPARSTVVSALVVPGALIEIEAMAMVPR